MCEKVLFFKSWKSYLFTTSPVCEGGAAVCHGWMVAVWWEKEAPGAQEMWCSAWIPDFFLSYYLVCILKVCLIHAWLTFILAIPCKGKWIMDPQGIIEPIQHIYFSPSVFFPLKRLWRLSTLFLFAVMYSKTYNISANGVWCKWFGLDCRSWL